eukprot:13200540-Alexandrium_andersonii.AAC.1
MRGHRGSASRAAAVHGSVAGQRFEAHSERKERAGKVPVGGRSVDRNKGGAGAPNARSRYITNASILERPCS